MRRSRRGATVLLRRLAEGAVVGHEIEARGESLRVGRFALFRAWIEILLLLLSLLPRMVP